MSGFICIVSYINTPIPLAMLKLLRTKTKKQTSSAPSSASPVPTSQTLNENEASSGKLPPDFALSLDLCLSVCYSLTRSFIQSLFSLSFPPYLMSAPLSDAKNGINNNNNGAVHPSRPARVRRKNIQEKPNYPLNLWGIMKNCIGKDLSKIPMPVNFSEPLSLLQRLSEDLEYSDILDQV